MGGVSWPWGLGRLSDVAKYSVFVSPSLCPFCPLSVPSSKTLNRGTPHVPWGIVFKPDTLSPPSPLPHLRLSLCRPGQLWLDSGASCYSVSLIKAQKLLDPEFSISCKQRMMFSLFSSDHCWGTQARPSRKEGMRVQAPCEPTMGSADLPQGGPRLPVSR